MMSTDVQYLLMSLGSRVREWRTFYNWTLDNLVDRSGVERGTISALENRDSRRSDFAGALAKAFGITTDELLDPALAPTNRLLSQHTPGNTGHSGYSTVSAYSVTKATRAPVIAWSRLGMELKLPNDQVPAEAQIPVPEEASHVCKWVVVERDHSRFGLRAGYKVALEPDLDGHEFRDNELYLFKTLGGKFFLAEYRTLASGFEAIPDSGPPLESARHGIEVVAIHKGTWK